MDDNTILPLEAWDSATLADASAFSRELCVSALEIGVASPLLEVYYDAIVEPQQSLKLSDCDHPLSVEITQLTLDMHLSDTGVTSNIGFCFQISLHCNPHKPA